MRRQCAQRLAAQPTGFARLRILFEAGSRNSGIRGDYGIHVVRQKQVGDGIDSSIIQIRRDLEGNWHITAVSARQEPLFVLEGGEQGG